MSNVSRYKTLAITLLLALAVSTYVIVELRTREKCPRIGEIYVWPEPDNYYVEVSGRAERFILLNDPPFFRFSMEVNSLRLEVMGSDRVTFMNDVISPKFSNLNIEWGAEPFVWIFGMKISDTVVIAYIVDVDVNCKRENWYYKSFLTKDERNHMAVLVNYKEKLVWVNGILTGGDLLGLLITPGFEPLQVPDPNLGKEAYACGTIFARFGIALVVENLFAKQNDSYIRIFP